MKSPRGNLIAYGTHLLASQLGQTWPPPGALPPGRLAEEAVRHVGSYGEDRRVQLVRRIVHDGSLEGGLEPVQEVRRVVPVFELLKAPPGAGVRDWKTRPLTPLTIPPPAGSEARASPSELWEGFWQALARLPAESDFDTFLYLVGRYGWNVPGTITDTLSPGFEHGLSVFEQFKAVAALAHCLDPELDETQPIGLVAGDLPGIQRVLYTITAKGAAKTLRGHSAYLQLVSDALLRLLLQQFELPWANVVFSAGGNFLVMTPGDAVERVGEWQDAVNEKLLALHRGELYLAMGSITIPARLYADGSPITEAGSLAERRAELQRELDKSKHAAFARLAPERYTAVFSAIGDGGPVSQGQPTGNLCEVCNVELDEATRVFEPDDPEHPGVGGTLLCEQCHSFAFRLDERYNSLAWSMANAERVLISDADGQVSLEAYSQGKGNPPWNEALQALGLKYEFIKPGQKVPTRPGTLLAFDPKRFLPEALDAGKAYGFRFLSQSTPRESGEGREIRDFHSMAQEDAIGVSRYGVLRMDVDSLGQTMSGRGLRYPDLLHLSALSSALEYFFGGLLDEIGQESVDTWGEWTTKWSGKAVDPEHKQPYVIYAGGDDLFIVAPWDLLPPLAQAIRERFDAYCLGRLTMSGGIALAREKYPLYRAAEQAGVALDESKDRIVEDRESMMIRAQKDALTFLGVTLAWEEVATARNLAERLVEMLSGYPHGDKAPRALLQLLYYIAQIYQREADSAEADSVQLGQWLPALHYGLRRMQRRVPESLKEELATIPEDILDLSAVWAAGKRLRTAPEEGEQSGQRSAEAELRRAIEAKLEYTRQAWPVIRYLGLPVRWAEFLTRKED
jgi:CRISPR-associated protein Csm1